MAHKTSFLKRGSYVVSCVTIGKPEQQLRKASHCGSNNNDHLMRSLCYHFFAPHIMYILMLFFAHIPLVMNCTFNATPELRLQQHPLLFTTNRTDHTFFFWGLPLARPSHSGHSTILL